MAGLIRTEILERIWGAKAEKRRAGKHPQSEITLPFGVGYERNQDRWYFKPEGEKVVAAFRYFLAGETSYTEVGRKVGVAPFNLRNVCVIQFIPAGAFTPKGVILLQRRCAYAQMGAKGTVPSSSVVLVKLFE
jgi:hypothetical protein